MGGALLFSIFLTPIAFMNNTIENFDPQVKPQSSQIQIILYDDLGNPFPNDSPVSYSLGESLQGQILDNGVPLPLDTNFFIVVDGMRTYTAVVNDANGGFTWNFDSYYGYEMGNDLRGTIFSPLESQSDGTFFYFDIDRDLTIHRGSPEEIVNSQWVNDAIMTDDVQLSYEIDSAGFQSLLDSSPGLFLQIGIEQYYNDDYGVITHYGTFGVRFYGNNTQGNPTSWFYQFPREYCNELYLKGTYAQPVDGGHNIRLSDFYISFNDLFRQCPTLNISSLTHLKIQNDLPYFIPNFSLEDDEELACAGIYPANTFNPTPYSTEIPINHIAIALDEGSDERFLYSTDLEVKFEKSIPYIESFVLPIVDIPSSQSTFNLTDIEGIQEISQFYLPFVDSKWKLFAIFEGERILFGQIDNKMDLSSLSFPIDLLPGHYTDIQLYFSGTEHYAPLNFSITADLCVSYPQIKNATLSPDSLYRNTDLSLSYEYFHSDDLPDSSLIHWHRNDILINQFTNTTVIPKSELSVGDIWYASIRAYDGTTWGWEILSESVTVLNAIPIISVELNASDIEGDHWLGMNISYSDLEEDECQSILTRWYRNDILQPQYNNFTIIFLQDTENTVDYWLCEVQVFDGYNMSDWMSSSSCTHWINDIPRIISVANASFDFNSRDNWMTLEIEDNLGDFIIVSILTETGEILWTSEYLSSGTHIFDIDLMEFDELFEDQTEVTLNITIWDGYSEVNYNVTITIIAEISDPTPEPSDTDDTLDENGIVGFAGCFIMISSVIGIVILIHSNKSKKSKN